MPWVNGGCHVVRLESLADVGLMDERMVQFGSDSDWCYAARAAGWEVWYCAEAEGVHEMSLSLGITGPALERCRRDMAVWAEKWLRSPHYERLAASAWPADPWGDLRRAALGLALGGRPA